MTYTTTMKQIKTKLTTRTSLFGLIAIMGMISMVSIDNIVFDKQSSFVAIAQTALWQLNDFGDLYYDGGNVGIGTKDPGTGLTIASSDPTFSLTTPGTGNWDHAYMNLITKEDNANGLFEPGEKGWHITSRGNSYAAENQPNDLIFARYDSEWKGHVVTLDFDSENVGIGTDSPSSKLHVADEKPVLKLQNTIYDSIENGFYGWIGGYDKTGDEIWWIGEGSSSGKTLGFYTNSDGYDLNLKNKGNGIIIKDDGDICIGNCS